MLFFSIFWYTKFFFTVTNYSDLSRNFFFSGFCTKQNHNVILKIGVLVELFEKIWLCKIKILSKQKMQKTLTWQRWSMKTIKYENDEIEKNKNFKNQKKNRRWKKKFLCLLRSEKNKKKNSDIFLCMISGCQSIQKKCQDSQNTISI